jgi:hypothetical protein
VTYEENTWRRHWDMLTYPQRLRFVSVLFDEAAPNDIVWQTPYPFEGYHKWWFMRSCDVC